jgi:hypothetical protein
MSTEQLWNDEYREKVEEKRSGSGSTQEKKNCFIATWPHLKSPGNEPGVHGKKPETGLSLGQ